MDLHGLRNAVVTDIPRGKIRNADAALIVLWNEGGTASTAALLSALRKWRPGKVFTYLLNTSDSGGYGFTATSFEQTHNDVFHHPYYARSKKGPGGRLVREHTSRRRTFWYRSARGQYSITLEGFKRLMELGVIR